MSERSEEDWGRVALSLPGWRWMPGMSERRESPYWLGRLVEQNFWPDGITTYPDMSGAWPGVDDPGTAGCLLALLGHGGSVRHDTHRGDDPNTYTAWCDVGGRGDGPTPGRAIVSLAESLGHWPGGGDV